MDDEMPNLLLLIIIMATNSRKLQLYPLRTSPRLSNPRTLLPPTLLTVPTAIDSEQSHNQPSLLHASQEYKHKLDRQTPSPITHSVAPPLPHPTEAFVPIIHNHSLQSSAILHDQLTPTPQQPSQLACQLPPLVVTNITNGQSWSQIPHDLQYDPPTTLKRICSRSSQTFSPFASARKSYRKLQKRQIVSIPYRRCHDALQGRIVAIINKMISGKNCHKDIESLIDKIAKISHKDMMNRYIVGGIRSIIAMVNERNLCETKIIGRLEIEQKKMKQKMENYLMNFEQFLCENESNSIDEQPFKENEHKTQFIRRIYNMTLKQFPQKDRTELRKKVIKECECCFNGDYTLSGLVKYLRNKLEGK